MKRIEVDRPIMSLNKWQRLHWRARGREKKAWIVLLANDRPDTRATTRQRVKIISYRKRLCDAVDNLACGAKPILDSLKHWGYIKDDSPAWIDGDVIQHKAGHYGERTVIIVEAVQADNDATSVS